jgi:ADP-ribosylglycohydrolase
LTSPVALCDVCAALPRGATPEIEWPAPVQADEWEHDDRIRGVLVGLAVGDAIGGLRHRGGELADDLAPGSIQTGGATQLALFTAEGLLRMRVRLAAKGIGPLWAVIRHGLDRWMLTQGRAPQPIFGPPEEEWPDGWLVRQHRMHRRVEGFSATVSALSTRIDPSEALVERRIPPEVPSTSAGAGALVRVAAVGLLLEPRDALLVGAITSVYTHGHPTGYLAGAALARIISGLVHGEAIDEAITQARVGLETWDGSAEIRSVLGGHPAQSASGAARALRAGLDYACLIKPAPGVAAAERATAKGGTAAGIVAGVISGARSGASAFPAWWSAAPDVADIIDEMIRATSTAHRTWVMGRAIAGYGGDPIAAREQEPCDFDLFWPRFPGW